MVFEGQTDFVESVAWHRRATRPANRCNERNKLLHISVEINKCYIALHPISLTLI